MSPADGFLDAILADPGYKNYGARGIQVCPRWRHSFEAFLEDVGPAPSPDLSIDRIDNDRGYEPGNCRWATPTQQARNRCSSRLLTHDGVTRTVAEWAEIAGLSRHTITERLDSSGWSVAEALTMPVLRYRRGGRHAGHP